MPTPSNRQRPSTSRSGDGMSSCKLSSLVPPVLPNHFAHQVSIKSQGPLDGKVMAAQCLRPWNLGNFSTAPGAFLSFRRQPELECERQQRNAADTCEPECGEPQQALRQGPR